MIELKSGDFLDAKVITAIRVAKRIVKDKDASFGSSHPPRVIIDFSGNVIVITSKTLRDARAYSVELHEKVKEELRQAAP